MTRNEFTPEQETWLKALESGCYRQCQQILHVRHSDATDAYCCLGVAVEVLGLQEASDCDLEATYEQLCLLTPAGEMRRPKESGAATLIGLNDGLSWSFKDIAAFIRANPWQVFTNFDAPQSAAERMRRGS